MALLLGKTKILEGQIDKLLDSIVEAGVLLEEGISSYLRDQEERFQAHLQGVTEKERIADKLRRDAENKLYTHSLIPEQRGDVLGLLEQVDHLADGAKQILFQFDVERPEIPTELHDNLIELAKFSVCAITELINAVRAFFRDVFAVKNYLHKVYFYEKEADKLADNIKRTIFQMEIPLSRKIHLRYFVLHIEELTDKAENGADMLSICTIKRMV